jgi:hypothetical protein
MYSYDRTAAAAQPKIEGPAEGGQPHRWTGGGIYQAVQGTRIYPDPFTRQEAHWLYRDQDGHHAIGITGTQFIGPDTGNVYQIEVHWMGPAEGVNRNQVKEEYWFAGRKPNGAWMTAMSKKFPSYDAASDYWWKRFKLAEERLKKDEDPQLSLSLAASVKGRE